MVPKKVKARIAVAVDSNGEWYAFGCDEESDEGSRQECVNAFRKGAHIEHHWIAAELPVPVPTTAAESVWVATSKPAAPAKGGARARS